MSPEARFDRVLDSFGWVEYFRGTPAVARRPLPVQALHELARLVRVVRRQAERDPRALHGTRRMPVIKA